MALSAPIQILDQDTRTVAATKGAADFGQPAVTSDGRTFAYGLNGTGSGTALAPGKLNQGALSVANHVNQTGVTVTAGTQQVTYTIGATTLTTNQYVNGYLSVNAGTGVGQTMSIASHGTSTSGSTAVTFNLHDAFYTTTAVSDSKFSLQPNEYSKIILEANGSSTAILPVGYALISVPDANYAWFQTGGPCAVLVNGTPGVGVNVVPSATTPGAVDVNTGSLFQQTVGVMMITGVSTQYQMCQLTIATS